MVGHASEGTPGWYMELQLQKVVQRALCEYFGISRGQYVQSAHFTPPPGFTSPPWSLTIGIPAGTWLFDKFPFLQSAATTGKQ
jgi:hypothetical protein